MILSELQALHDLPCTPTTHGRCATSLAWEAAAFRLCSDVLMRSLTSCVQSDTLGLIARLDDVAVTDQRGEREGPFIRSRPAGRGSACLQLWSRGNALHEVKGPSRRRREEPE